MKTTDWEGVTPEQLAKELDGVEDADGCVISFNEKTVLIGLKVEDSIKVAAVYSHREALGIAADIIEGVARYAKL